MQAAPKKSSIKEALLSRDKEKTKRARKLNTDTMEEGKDQPIWRNGPSLRLCFGETKIREKELESKILIPRERENASHS